MPRCNELLSLSFKVDGIASVAPLGMLHDIRGRSSTEFSKVNYLCDAQSFSPSVGHSVFPYETVR